MNDAPMEDLAAVWMVGPLDNLINVEPGVILFTTHGALSASQLFTSLGQDYYQLTYQGSISVGSKDYLKPYCIAFGLLTEWYSFFGYDPVPDAPRCIHQWKEYIGFTDRYYYCTLCDEKNKS